MSIWMLHKNNARRAHTHTERFCLFNLLLWESWILDEVQGEFGQWYCWWQSSILRTTERMYLEKHVSRPVIHGRSWCLRNSIVGWERWSSRLAMRASLLPSLKPTHHLKLFRNIVFRWSLARCTFVHALKFYVNHGQVVFVLVIHLAEIFIFLGIVWCEKRIASEEKKKRKRRRHNPMTWDKGDLLLMAEILH